MPDVVALSARSGAALEAMRGRLADHLESQGGTIGEVAATVQLGRQAMAHRAAVVARDTRTAAQALRTVKPERTGPPGEGGIVFVFPGQGAQYAGMGAALATSCPPFAREFAAIAAKFAPLLGRDLHDLFVPELAEGVLARADGLQPGLFAVELALARVLMGWGIRPSAVAGHSLGQYVAAVVGGVLTLDDAVRLVAARAKATDEAGEGAMMQVAMGEAEIAGLLAAHPDVGVAAVNSSRDVVVAGPCDAIAAFDVAAAKGGVGVRRLPAGRAFHSPMMAGVAEALRGVAPGDAARGALIPVACNVTGGWLAGPVHAAYWARHVLEPVRFADNAKAVMALKPSLVIEVGPGSTLRGLMARSAPPPSPADLICAMRHPADRGRTDADALCEAVARSFEAGAGVDWRAFREGRTTRKTVLPAYPFATTRCWPEVDVAQAHGSVATREIERRLPWGERFYVPSLKRSGQARPSAEGAQTWLVLADEAQAALGLALEGALRGGGHRVQLVARRDGVGAALASVAGGDEVRVVCAWPQAAAGGDLAALMALAQTLIRAQRRVGLFVLVPPGLDGAMVLGPLLSLTQEAPSVVARVIETDGLGVAAVTAELVADRREAWVGLRGGGRWVERFDSLTLGTAERVAGEARLALGPHIITGGMGRIGRALAAYLAGLGADVIVVSRKARTLTDDGGGRIRFVRADAAAPGEMARVMSDCLARHGRIGGVFHAAGVAAVCEIRDVTADALAVELAPKVAGTRHLAEGIAGLAEDKRPKFVMVFSSLAASLGGLGLGPYAAANRFMDAFVAAQPVRDGVAWISAAWDDWAFDYGDAQMGAYAQTRAKLAIEPDEGLAAIAAIVGEGTLHNVLITATPLEARLDRWTSRDGVRGQIVPEITSAVTGGGGKGVTAQEARVRAAYVRVLGGSPGLDDDFFALGGDSLLATQIVLALTGTDLRIADVFDYASIRRLAGHIAAHAKGGLQVSA